LLKDNWLEYYDGKLGRDIGKQTRKFQTWWIAGYLVAKTMLGDPSNLGMISLEEDMIKAQFPEFFLETREMLGERDDTFRFSELMWQHTWQS
jgi:hypothetical protein